MNHSYFPGLTDAEWEDFQEKAAILEYCAELPRAEAEKQAYEMILKARKSRQSADVPRRTE